MKIEPLKMFNSNYMPQQSLLNYGTAFTSWLAATFASEVVSPASAHNGWLNSAVISALVVGTIMILKELLVRIFDIREKKQKRTDDMNREKQDRADELHTREVNLLKEQIFLERIESFQARKRAHRYGNEVSRLHAHVYGCHSEIGRLNGTIPEFKLKFGEELMDGIDEEVEKFKQSISARIDEVIHRTSDGAHMTNA